MQTVFRRKISLYGNGFIRRRFYIGGYIRENSRGKGIEEALVSDYKKALEKLPEKKNLIVTGGTLEYHKDLIFGVLKELNVKSRIAGKVDAINGLCYLAKAEEK